MCQSVSVHRHATTSANTELMVSNQIQVINRKNISRRWHTRFVQTNGNVPECSWLLKRRMNSIIQSMNWMRYLQDCCQRLWSMFTHLMNVFITSGIEYWKRKNKTNSTGRTIRPVRSIFARHECHLRQLAWYVYDMRINYLHIFVIVHGR